ncbi:MAG: ATPase, T2SS/T4P/T4SS family, partial [Candidatus Micrarchaeota archaeon]
MVGEYVVKSEGGKKQLIINYKGAPYGADIAQYAACMKDVVQKLREVDADEIVLSEYYERIYDEDQTRMLKGIGDLISKFEGSTIWSPVNLGTTTDSRVLAPRHDAIMQFLDLLPADPFRAYLFVLQELKTQIAKGSGASEASLEDLKTYIKTLTFIRSEIEKTDMIQAMKKYLLQLTSIPADRNIYHSIFESAIKPSFIGSRIFFTGVENLSLIDQYEILGTKIYIYKHPEKIELLYYINPPEYTLAPDKYFLLEKTKEVVSTHRPASVSFLDMQQARKYFRKIYAATINDLAQANSIKISAEEKDELATIVSRYTIGYGILEIILSDRQITDVYIDSPLGDKPIYLVHSKYGQCQTNIIYSEEEAKSLVSRFRALSGRPFDEAHPILDFDLPDLQTRVAAIGKPLAVDGTAFALRLHKETPWTLAQFLDFKMFNPLTAGMLSFMVDAQASTLIVGSRGAGKCLDKNTLLQTADGNLKPIGEVVEKCLSKSSKLIQLDDGICADLSQNGLSISVPSMDPNLQIRKLPVEKVWRRNAPNRMMKFLFASGKQILVTPEHPFFTVEESKVTMKRADGFSVGEYVASPRQLNASGNYQSVSMLHPELKYDGCGKQISGALREMQWQQPLTLIASDSQTSYRTLRNLKDSVRKSAFLSEIRLLCDYSGEQPISYISNFENAIAGTNSLKLPFQANLDLDEDFGRFLGLLMGDGHLDEKKIEFTNTNDALRNEFGHLAEKVFRIRGRTILPKNRSPNYQISCKPLFYILRDKLGIISGDKASTQAIPEKLLLSPNSVLASFIGGYFDCDSSVSVTKHEVEFCTASESIARQMQLALQRFGIISFLKPKDVRGITYYRLFIRGENAAKFAQSIPMHHPQKLVRLRKLLSSSGKFNTNIDVVPNAWGLLRECKQLHGFGKTSLDQHNLTPKTLQKLHSKLLEKGVENGPLVDSLKKLAYNDLFWDKIVSVEEIPCGEKYVYDLTVGGTHSFIANGLVVHNTSILQAMMQEITQNLRIIVQEDSVTGDSEIMVERNGDLERTTVGELIDGLIEKYG